MTEREIVLQSASIEELPVTTRKRLRILVVGAGGELGSALAERFAKKSVGHRMILAGRSKKQLDKTFTTCMKKKAAATEISTVTIEVRKENSCKTVVENSAAALGGLDLVIYASSKDVKGKVEEVEDFLKLSKKVMETIFFGAVYVTKYALPHLIKSQGQLVAFSASEADSQHAAIYVAAKHSIKGFFDSVKKENTNIIVTVIEEVKKPVPLTSSQTIPVAIPAPLSVVKLEGSTSDESIPTKLSVDDIIKIIRHESKSHGRPSMSRSRTQSLRLPKVVQLQEAIKKGRLDQVKSLLRDLPPNTLEAIDDQNKTPLHLAAFYGMPQIAKLLLKKKASLMAKDKDGYTPILTAAASGHMKVLILLLSKASSAEAKAVTPKGESLLHLLAASAPQQQEPRTSTPISSPMSARLSTINQPMLLSAEAPSPRSSVISPRATISASSGTISQVLGNEFMKDLVKVLRSISEKSAVDLDVKDENNVTALHRACENGQYELVAWMLRNGAAINLQDKVGDTPLHYAVRSGNRSIVKYLVENNADPTIVGEKGKPFEQPDILPKILEFWTSHQEAQEAKKQAAASAAAAATERKLVTSTSKSSLRPTSVVQKKQKEEKDEAEKTPEIDESELKKKEPIVIRSYDDLPSSYHPLIKRAELDVEKITQNWEVFVHVLRFVSRKNFRVHGPNSYEAPQNHSSGHLSVDDDSPESAASETTQDESDKKSKKKRKEPKSRSNVQTNIKQATEQFLLTENPKKIYKILDQAGKGGFGSVYLAKAGTDKRRYAVKKMPHSTVKERRQNIDEVIFLRQCDHPNIVKLFSAFDLGEEIWLVMEFMEGGSLQEAVNLCKFKENQIAYVAKEMLKGISYLHSKNLAHRDLKSANVMMSVEGEVKLIDFGLCIDATIVQSTHMVGSPFWTPPEMIRSEVHGLPVDIWSFGICIIEMANGKPPHIKSALRAMFNAAVEPAPTLEDPSWSSQFADFLSLALKKDQRERATADELLKHEFLTKAATKKSMNGILGSVFVDKSIEQSLGF